MRIWYTFPCDLNDPDANIDFCYFQVTREQWRLHQIKYEMITAYEEEAMEMFRRYADQAMDKRKSFVDWIVEDFEAI